MKHLLYTLLLISLFSCKRDRQYLPAAPAYEFNTKRVETYTNEYNGKGLLVKQSAHLQTTNPYGTGTDEWEVHYFYDDRDSLREIREYTPMPQAPYKELYGVELRTDSTRERTLYRQYPNDTASYRFYRLDANQNEIEEYTKESFDTPYEFRIIRTYIDNQLTSAAREDILNRVTDIRTYTSETRNDTLFTFVYKNKELVWETKNYQDHDIAIQVGRSINDPNSCVDSLFFSKEKCEEINYYADAKQVTKIRYDEHGNETERITEIWDKR